MDKEQYTQKTDEELVLLTLEDREVFAYIIDRYEKPLSRYIVRLMPSMRDSVEDILQEVFIKVYVNLRGFEGNLKFSSWIYRITHNHVISLLRRQKARPTVVSLDADENETLARFTADENIDRKDAKYAKEEVSYIIGILPEKYREVLILRYMEEKDYEEIADILKKPVGTVGTLISRAKAVFKEEYQKRYGK